MALASALAIVSALTSVYSATKSPPKAAGQTTTAPVTGGNTGAKAQDVFSVATPQHPAPGPVSMDSNSFLATLLPALLGSGQPQPVGTGTVLKPQDPGMSPTTEAAPASPAAGKKPSISDILGSVPEALAAAAPLLGLGQDQRQPSTHVVGAQGGGSGGQVVQGLQLPRRTSLAELLAALPRPRYG